MSLNLLTWDPMDRFFDDDWMRPSWFADLHRQPHHHHHQHLHHQQQQQQRRSSATQPRQRRHDQRTAVKEQHIPIQQQQQQQQPQQEQVADREQRLQQCNDQCATQCQTECQQQQQQLQQHQQQTEQQQQQQQQQQQRRLCEPSFVQRMLPFRFGSTDIVENDRELVFHMDVPGMRSEDIKVRVLENNILHMSGERVMTECCDDEPASPQAQAATEPTQPTPTTEGVASPSATTTTPTTPSQAQSASRRPSRTRCHRVERSFGCFERHFRLPSNVDVAQISARVENGVLTVRVPMKEVMPPTVQEITVQ